MANSTGIYIHIPFCVKKCSYCAFLSFDAGASPRKEYTDALVNEIRSRARAFRGRSIDTVYIGGGTPSVLDISQLRDIMHAVVTCFDIKDDAEITLEANPGTLGSKDGVTLAKLQAYRYMGINRLSMGVQAMDNGRLHFLGRIHTAENVVRDMELIRQKGFDNVNLDLIFSVPGESTADALDDLKKIIDLRPEHISCYSLQTEEGTPLCEMIESGELYEVSDEEDRTTYHEICRQLREAGYEHYEISNFARMDSADRCAGDDRSGADSRHSVSPFRSRHNSLYWDMSDYIGLGLGASGFTDGVRYRNTTDLKEYIAYFSEERAADEGLSVPAAEVHVNSAFDNISEAVFTGLRRAEGITYKAALEAYDRGAASGVGSRAEPTDERERFWSIFAEARREAEGFAEDGYLLIDERGLRLTERGIDISNSIMSLFV